MTDSNTRTASPSPDRIELPGGWYFRLDTLNDSGWHLFTPEGYRLVEWGEDTALAFAAALASPPPTADAPSHVGGFTHAEYRDTAALLRSDEATRARVASNRHNVILAALDYLANQSADAPSPAPDAAPVDPVAGFTHARNPGDPPTRCPTCGTSVRILEPRPFVFEEDEPDASRSRQEGS